MKRLVELRDLEEARLYLLQGLWLQRVVPPIASNVEPILRWAGEIVNSGQPLPGLGAIADLGHCVFSPVLPGKRDDFREVPGLPQGMLRNYEDCFLGKIYGGSNFVAHEEQEANAMNLVKGNTEYYLKLQKRMLELCQKRAEHNEKLLADAKAKKE